MNSQLSPIQQRLLIMISWYHDFCVKNRLTYFIIGGTMLGAVRHKGFIPWDDDIDVGMPREDYERFLELTEGRITDHYTTESFRSGKTDYVYPFAKLYDVNTTLVDNKRIPVRRGVFIDVFPIDGVGETDKWRSDYKKFRFRKNLLSVLSADVEKNRRSMANAAIFAARVIPFHRQLIGRLLREIDAFCKSASYETSAKVANINGSRRSKEILDKEIWGTPCLYQFEDLQLYGVELADRYLSELIGDYMQLPPENKRYGHFTGECDLNKGYLQ